MVETTTTQRGQMDTQRQQQQPKQGTTGGSGLQANLTDVFRNWRGPQGNVRVTVDFTSPQRISVSNNNVLTPTMVQNRPQVKIDTPSGYKFYTLMMIDPDAPSRDNPTNAQWCHWMVTNIPENGQVDRGEEVVGYVGAGPPKGSGFHRYVLALFGHNDKITSDLRIPSNKSKGRAKFNAEQFVQKHKMGEPLWVDSFEAQWDNHVPKLYETFTD